MLVEEENVSSFSDPLVEKLPTLTKELSKIDDKTLHAFLSAEWKKWYDSQPIEIRSIIDYIPDTDIINIVKECARK